MSIIDRVSQHGACDIPLLLPRAHTLTMDSRQGNVLIRAFAVIRSTNCEQEPGNAPVFGRSCLWAGAGCRFGGAHLCRVAGDTRVSSSCCVGWDTGTGGWARRWLMPAGRGAGDARMRVYSRHAAGDARVSPGCCIVVRTGTGECADISRLLCWLAYRNLNNAATVTPARPARPASRPTPNLAPRPPNLSVRLRPSLRHTSHNPPCATGKITPPRLR